MDKGKQLRSVSTDLLWSISAMVVLNATIQFILYPKLHVRLGDVSFGDMLTLLSVVSIIATSFGSAANYARMFASVKNKAYSSDYLNYLFITSVLCMPVLLISLKTIDELSIKTMILYGVLTIVSLLRYYGDVEYRLCLNYRKYFLFYFCIAAGYILGLLVLRRGEHWYHILIIGELCAIGFAALTSDLFKNYSPIPTEFFRGNSVGWIQLSLSNLISALVLNADRIIIRYFISGEAVTLFYVATLLGKVIALIGTPLNGVLIGYITKWRDLITKKVILLVCSVSVLIVPIMGICCTVGSRIMVPILYPNLADMDYIFVFVACLGQVMYFVSNTLMVFVMKMHGEKMALWISIGYGVLFFAISIPMVLQFGLMGMAYAILIVNAIKLCAIVILSYVAADKKTIDAI